MIAINGIDVCYHSFFTLSKYKIISSSIINTVKESYPFYCCSNLPVIFFILILYITHFTLLLSSKSVVTSC